MFAYSFNKFKVKIMFTANVSLILRWLIFWKRWLLVLNGVSLRSIILRRLVIEQKNMSHLICSAAIRLSEFYIKHIRYIALQNTNWLFSRFPANFMWNFYFFFKYFIKLMFDLNSKNHPPISILIVLLKTYITLCVPLYPSCI